MEDRKGYGPELLGKWLRILRGKRSQMSVQAETGVKQYTISTIEAGKVERPSYEDVTRLAVYYGVTPNELAAMVGLFPLPDEVADEENFTPALLQAMRELRQVAYEMARDEQDYLATLLRGTVAAERHRRKSRYPDPEEDELAEAPAWLQHRLRRANGAASSNQS